jgi:predicted dehydrogenase
MEQETKPAGAAMDRRKFITGAAALSAFLIVPRHVLGGKGFVAPSDRINLGFIGSGRQSLTLQKAFLPLAECRIIAACDVYRSKVDNFSRLVNTHYATQHKKGRYKGCKTYHRFTELLDNRDIDAVVIATPDHWHAAMAVRAAAAGKDIYCEKPLSLTVAEGRAMVNAAAQHKRVFQTGSMQRSRPEFRQTVELVRNGYIGDIKNVKVSIGGPPVPYDLPEETLPADLDWPLWLGPNEYVHYNHELDPVVGDSVWGRWRDFKGLGGGDVTDWGAHMFDIVQWALDMDNSGPVSFTPPDGGEVQHMTMRYGNGIVMTHENFGKQHAIQFNGTKGKIEIQRNKLVTMPENLKDKVIGSNEKQVYHSSSHYLDFLQAVKARSKPVADVETGHRSASVCNLINIAYELNMPLEWDPQQERITNHADANRLLSRKMKQEWAV